MKPKELMPTMWLLIGLILEVLLHFVVSGMRLLAAPWTLVGLVPIGVGVWINLAADKAFHGANTTVKPFESSSVLVRDGVFGISRNPMYLGFALILLGEALLFGSLTPFAVVVAFVIGMDRMYIAKEEEMLAEDFGNEWSSYAATTRRWL
jgi:protein-S-isoprenylcysteine O-methyltransferase Ste14